MSEIARVRETADVENMFASIGGINDAGEKWSTFMQIDAHT